ncbi:hypothetical protein DFH06DRAFT_1141425 [Mycena polygramma]|nr:hypothetical protein DFH06DRAFT_1141425 [Mycena polygramma]
MHHDTDTHIHRHVLLYPQDEDVRRYSCWMLEGPVPTLASIGGCISFSPAECRTCPKPSLTYTKLAPGFSFTILMSCPHHPDARLSPNQSIMKILPEGHKSKKACVGNLWIIKHKAPPGSSSNMSNKRLPVVDFDDADLPYNASKFGCGRVTREVIQAASYVTCNGNRQRDFVQTKNRQRENKGHPLSICQIPRPRNLADAGWLPFVSPLSGLCLRKGPLLIFVRRHTICRLNDLLGDPTTSNLDALNFAPGVHEMISPIEISHQHLIFGCFLSRTNSIRISSRNNRPSVSCPVPVYYEIDSDSDTPIPVFDIDSDTDDVVSAVHPLDPLDESIAHLTLEENPGPRTPQTPPPAYQHPPSLSSASPRRTYTFTSPRRTGRTNDWSEAAEATQGSPMAHVRTVHRSRPASSRPAVYIVFRGHNVSVRLTWREVEADTSGVQFSFQQGYRTEPDAQAAFELAHTNGWTCTSSEWALTPISRSQAPLPMTEENPLSPSRLSARSPGDSCLECVLNVLGISCSWYDRAESYSAAVAQFQRAMGRREVHDLESCEGQIYSRRRLRSFKANEDSNRSYRAYSQDWILKRPSYSQIPNAKSQMPSPKCHALYTPYTRLIHALYTPYTRLVGSVRFTITPVESGVRVSPQGRANVFSTRNGTI